MDEWYCRGKRQNYVTKLVYTVERVHCKCADREEQSVPGLMPHVGHALAKVTALHFLLSSFILSFLHLLTCV
jgi:hypothetical protein